MVKYVFKVGRNDPAFVELADTLVRLLQATDGELVQSLELTGRALGDVEVAEIRASLAKRSWESGVHDELGLALVHREARWGLGRVNDGLVQDHVERALWSALFHLEALLGRDEQIRIEEEK